MIRKKEGFEGELAIILPPKVVGQFSNKPISGELYITDMGYYPKAKYHYRERPKGAEEHILIHCVEGKGEAKVEGRHYQVHPNEFLVIPAGLRHTYRAHADQPWTIYWMHFKGKQARPLSQRLYELVIAQKNKVMYDETHVDVFQQIYQVLQQGYGRENMEYIALTLPYYFSAFLFNDRFNRIPGQPMDDLSYKVIQFLQDHIDKAISLKEIADHVHFSVSYFSNIFHKKTGYSPIEYFNHLKIQKACQLLQFTDKRIYEVALAIGIQDPYYFSRLFTAHMGVSPKRYRNQWSILAKP